MNNTTFDKSGSFVASQFQSLEHLQNPTGSRTVGPAITLSHQTGAGAHEVAKRLAKILQALDRDGAAWTVLDRQIVEKALEEHHLPLELAKKMPENKRSYVTEVIDDFWGLRPPSWVLVPQVVETMWHLAEAGHVILIGRGATIVTAGMAHVLHVRLVASLASRVKRVEQSHNLDARAAAEFVETEDRGRERYVKANFHARVDDDLLYHLVINTDMIPFGDAADIIAHAASRCFDSSAHVPA